LIEDDLRRIYASNRALGSSGRLVFGGQAPLQRHNDLLRFLPELRRYPLIPDRSAPPIVSTHRIYQVRGDTDLLVNLPDTPLQDVLHAKLPTHVWNLERLAFKDIR
jgi:hypothetical protein